MGAWLRSIERLLVAIAAVCGFWGGLTIGEQAYYRHAARELAQATRARVAVAPAAAADASVSPAGELPDLSYLDPPSVPTATLAPASLIGELEVPHLRIATAVVEGAGAAALRRGAGHIPGTALPGTAGNVGLAGHRDTVFRRLGELQRGDRIRLTTSGGIFDYRVARTLRVAPRDVWVLDRHAAALTLITCYPFDWVGAAPERWVVQADPIE